MSDDILYLCQLFLTSLTLTVSVTLGQVNQEIYSEQDLLAIDSESHSTVVMAPPPPTFLATNTVEGKSWKKQESKKQKAKSLLSSRLHYCVWLLWVTTLSRETE